MRIIRFEAENIKKLKLVDVTPKDAPGVVKVTGKNGQGKTSFLDGILYTLAGTEDLPSQPIRKGADKGFTRVDLGEFWVVRRYYPGRPSQLIIEGKKGERYAKPQQKLDDLFGKISFDPLAFTRMKPKEQADTLRNLVRLDVDPDAIDRENKIDYDERTIVNRTIKELEAQLAGISVVAELPEQPIDISALLAAMEKAGQINADIERERGELKRREDTTEEWIAAAGRLREQAAALRLQADQLEKSADLKEGMADADKKARALLKFPKPLDTAKIREQIENARATNSQIEKRTQKEQKQKDLDAQEAKAKALKEAIEARNKTKADAISAANMPVEGLGFAEGEVTFGGFPLNQASGAEQLRVSLAVAMAGKPEGRVILVKDGSLLDDESMAIVNEMAIANDFQIWIEAVDASGKVGIVMEDGEVKTVNEDESLATYQDAPELEKVLSKAVDDAKLGPKAVKRTRKA
jgi:hypothetical protein